MVGPGFATFIGSQDGVAQGIAQTIEKTAAPKIVPPALGMDTFWVRAHVEEVGPLLIAQSLAVGWANDMRLAGISKFKFWSRSAIRTGNQQHGLTLMGNSSRCRFIDQATSGKTVERKRRIDWMGFTPGDVMGKDMARARRRFEAAGTPAAIDE